MLKSYFNKDSVNKLLKLAIPMFLEMLLGSLLMVVDTLMITKYNEKNVASIGNAQVVLNFMVVLFNICSVGVGITVSQYIGGGKKEISRKVLSHGMLFNLVLSLLIFFVLFFFNMPLLKMVLTPNDIIEESSNYIKIVSVGLPFLAMTSCISANLKAHSKPYYVTIISFATNFLNVILNYILIYGLCGIPALGYIGAAISTASCYFVTFIVAVIISRFSIKSQFVVRSFNKEIFSSIIKIGVPSAVENICYNVSMLFVASQVNILLSDMITARSYINVILNFILIFSSAFGSANSIIVGYNVGSHNYDGAKKATTFTFLICYPIIMLAVTILNLTGKLIFPLITSNTVILNAIYSVLPIIFLLESGRCCNIIYINMLKSSGDTLYPVLCAIFSMFIIAAYGSYLFVSVFHFGLIGIFLAQALDEITRAVLVLFRFKSNKWMSKSLV